MMEKFLRKIKKYSQLKLIDKNPEKIGFNNKPGEFGLYIKLNAADSAVDVIIK